jgi:hypothetical protein
MNAADIHVYAKVNHGYDGTSGHPQTSASSLSSSSSFPLSSLLLTLSGTLFAGYMSYEKYVQETCLFNEPCPEFVGYPACYFGFSMFLFMFINSLLAYVKKINRVKIILITSTVGSVFAGYFVTEEYSSHGLFGRLGLSTCTWGFLVFLLIFLLSLKETKQQAHKH